MAPLKHLVVAAMAGLVVLTASVSTDAAAVPAVTSSAVGALSDADLTSALMRLAAADDAATDAKEISDADTDAYGDEEALVIDDASRHASKPHHHHKCKKFIFVKVCKRVRFVCKKKFSVHALDGADAEDGADAVDEAVAADTGDAATDDMEIKAADRQHKKHKAFKKKVVVVKKKVVVIKPKFCIRKVCKRVKKCVFV